MTEESLAPVKYGWGKNPASQSNLKPYKPGESGQGSHSGPMVTPALRRVIVRQLRDVEELYADRDNLPAVEAIAVTLIHNAVQNTLAGQKALETVITRLDGVADHGQPSVAVQVNLQFGDGEQA